MDAPATTALAKDGRLNRPKAQLPIWPRIPTKLAAAREHYDAAQEGHGYVYSQSPYSAHQGNG